VVFRRRSFLETGTKQSVTDWEEEEAATISNMENIMCFLNIHAWKPIVEPENKTSTL